MQSPNNTLLPDSSFIIVLKTSKTQVDSRRKLHVLPELCKHSVNLLTPRTSNKTIVEPEIKVMAFVFGVMQSTTCYSRNENRDAHLYKTRHHTRSSPDPPLPRDMNVDEALEQGE